MSSATLGWVFTHSPYNGALFAVHLAVGDVANDTHDYELWCSVATLAGKARVSERSARDALARLCEDGYLELLAEEPGRPRRYRFLMPNPGNGCTPAESAPRQRVHPTPAARSGGPRQSVPRTPAATADKLERTQEGTSRELKPARVAEPDDFERWWHAYPRRVDKARARKAWKTATKKTTVAVLIEAAERYRDDPNRDDEFTKHPTTWLNAEAWENGPLPARNGTRSAPKGFAAVEGFLSRQEVAPRFKELGR